MKNRITLLFFILIISCKSMENPKEVIQIDNLEYKIIFDNLDGWNKSNNKNDYQNRIEYVYFLSGDSRENAKAVLEIVHCGFKGVSVEEFYNYEMNYIKNFYENQKCQIIFENWNPYININFPNTFQALPVYYQIVSKNTIMNVKVLYIRLNYDFYIINFKSPEKDLISDNNLKSFYESLNFKLQDSKNIKIDYNIENLILENWNLVYHENQNENKSYEFIKNDDKFNNWKQMIHLLNYSTNRKIQFSDIEKTIVKKQELHKSLANEIHFEILNEDKKNLLMKYLIISNNFNDDHTSEIEIGIIQGIGNTLIMKLFLEKGNEIDAEEKNYRIEILNKIKYK